MNCPRCGKETNYTMKYNTQALCIDCYVDVRYRLPNDEDSEITKAIKTTKVHCTNCGWSGIMAQTALVKNTETEFGIFKGCPSCKTDNIVVRPQQ